MADKTILVVDDDAVFQSSLTEILNQAGYRAYGASDGRNAIGIAQSLPNEIDLMVLEMALPDMSSVAVIEAIAARQQTAIKVIASSSIFSQAELDSQTSFRAHAGISKGISGTPALAAKWLLTARSLLGELADPAPALLPHVILVVDDDALVRHFVKTMLSGEGYQVLEAGDGPSALVLAGKLSGAVDLVVTDIEMPGMDGLTLGKAIREADPGVPVIYISGFTEARGVKNVHKPEQGSVFIAKPFRPQALLEAIRSLLNGEKGTG